MTIRKLSDSPLKILKRLSDSRFYLQKEMALDLGIERESVTKIIQRLKGYGVDIQSDIQGVFFNTPFIPLNKQDIAPFLEGFDTEIEIFETLPSTSDYLDSIVSSKEINICLFNFQ